MFIAQSFICDLRRSDKDVMQSSILASNIADSLWEFAIFLVSCEPLKRKTIHWSFYVIDQENSLHMLLPNGEFSLKKVRNALEMFASNHYLSTIPVSQNLLASAIDLCTMDQNHPSIFIFIPSKYEWDNQINQTLNRIQIAKENPNEITLSIISDYEDDDTSNLIDQIASQTMPIINLINRNDCFFQFFRTIAEPIFFQPKHEILELGSNLIECLKYPLILPQCEINSIQTCTCHNLPLNKTENRVCSVTNKKISNSNISLEYAIGNFVVPFNESEIGSNRQLHIIGRLSTSQISESILIGETSILTSDNSKFHRVINELRCSKEVLLARRTTSTIVGGEYYALSPDSVAAILHMKNIATRCQLFKFDLGEYEQIPSEICTTGMIEDIQQYDDINPFLLGNEELSMHFSKNRK